LAYPWAKSLIYSETVTVGGIATSIPITITGGEYSINGGTYTSANGTVVNGDRVTLRQTSSSLLLTQTDVTVNIGGVVGTFRVTTMDCYPIFLPLIITK
jgi:hypothetical protein